MGIYLYTLKRPFIYKSKHLEGVKFTNKWLEIWPDGTATVSQDYAWDGCSPKYKVFGVVFGIPDGPIKEHGYPQTGFASVLHDALCQFRYTIPISKEQTVAVFDDLLNEAEWPLRKVYVKAVDLFGPQKFTVPSS